jgi:hypothetical protein
MENFNIDEIITNLNDLVNLYKDNPYILLRLNTHLTNLPNILEQENKRYEERVSRFNELSLEQENFYKVFLSKHQYYYMPYNNIYYEYDGKSYKIIKDDDIHHKLLSTITDEGKLIQWKHKTKQNIIKQIKERSLFKSTPETNTIQNVLGFLQTIFQSKTESKYFLTVVGDCILKKNTEGLVYYVSSHAKKLVTLIDSITYVTTGNSIMNNFITKYHDTHKIALYRLIKTNDASNSNTLSFDIMKDILNNIGIDLLCVATHYSDRYIIADNYLKTKVDDNIKNYILYFENNTVEKIVDDFLLQCIEKVSPHANSTITWKNMHYIWKLYLSNNNIPNMIYSSQLQSMLSNILTNNNNNNNNNNSNNNEPDNGNLFFTNVTSKYLPNVSSFLSFWDKHITILNGQDNLDDEYEIDELTTLYKNSDNKNVQISDASIIKMICHYFSPQVEIIDNKYITNIRCNLWSKQDDILFFLQHYKNSVYNLNLELELDLDKELEKEFQLISFDELYQAYKTYLKAKGIIEQRNLPIVSKQFFEKYLLNNLSNYVKFEKFVSSEWLVI